MRLYVNLANNAIVPSLNNPGAASAFTLTNKRGDTPALQWLFGNLFGNPMEIDPAGTALTKFILGAKKVGDFAGNYILSNWNGAAYAYTKTQGLTFTDGTTATNTTFTSASAQFTQFDVGSGIVCAGVPANTTIAAVNANGTTITLSQAATATAAGLTFSIVPTTQTQIAARSPLYTVSPNLNVIELNDLFITDATFLPNLATRTPANAAARFGLVGLVEGQVVRQTDTQAYYQVIDHTQLGNANGWSTDVTENSSVTLAGELTWATAGNQESTATFNWIIDNDYNQGGEGNPVSANPTYWAVGTNARIVPTGTGLKIQTSPDGLVWNDQIAWP